MEVKKTSKASLEDKKVIFLMIGFVMVLSLMYIGLEWTQSEVTVYESFSNDFLVEDELDIIQTNQDLPPPPPPPPTPEVVEVLNVVENNKTTVSIDINTEIDNNKIEEIIAAPIATPIEEDEDQMVFQVVETMPSFPGGAAELFKYLSINIKYPIIAEINGIQGRVICQFVVNKDGSIVDIEVVKSVDPNLDKEAIRVIKAMPKWSPGKRHGRFVRVKYTLPVVFKLQ
jgi:protein TonB